jgi:hypothetical protein
MQSMTAKKAPGIVSVWVGHFDDEDSLLSYVEKYYPSDDQVSTSRFLQDIPVGLYDEDFAEASFFASRDMERTIDEHSYASSFAVDVLKDIRQHGPDINSLYLIYDIDASDTESSRGPLRFIGAYPYTKQ